MLSNLSTRAQTILGLAVVGFLILTVVFVVASLDSQIKRTEYYSSAAPTTASASYSSGDTLFLETVHERLSLAQASNSYLLQSARFICQQRQAGVTSSALTSYYSRYFPPYDAGFLVGASQQEYCSAY